MLQFATCATPHQRAGANVSFVRVWIREYRTGQSAIMKPSWGLVQNPAKYLKNYKPGSTNTWPLWLPHTTRP